MKKITLIIGMFVAVFALHAQGQDAYVKAIRVTLTNWKIKMVIYVYIHVAERRCGEAISSELASGGVERKDGCLNL